MKQKIISLTAVLLCLAAMTGLARSAFAEGTAPIAENLELRTYRGVSVGGELKAYDPDGDLIDFTVTTQPVKGSLSLEEDGSFVYTPAEGKKGRDYFGYKAVDAEGNCSQEATVIIKIEKQSKDVYYPDMRGSADEYAAVLLSEKNIFTAEQLGGEYCFKPAESVSRGEFLSVCMLASGRPIVKSTSGTGFVNDPGIPDYARNYVASAVMCGVCYQDAKSGRTFNASEPISRSEAALILDRAMELTNVSYMPLGDEYSPELAQACVNLSACGLSEINPSAKDPLTRAEMARMLCAAIALVEKR